MFQEFFGQLFPSRVVARQGYLGIFGGPWGTLGGTEGKKFLRENIFSKNYISENYFSGIFRKTCFRSCCGPIGVFRDLWGPWGTLGGTEGNIYTRKNFSKNYTRKLFFENLGKHFSARVVARQGYLGIFGGPWGTLGGTEGKMFHAKIVLPKILYPKTIFQEFFGQLFPLVLWPDRGIYRFLGAPRGTLGGTEGKLFYAKTFSAKNLYRKKHFSRFFRKTFFRSCCGPIGVFRDLWGPWGTLGGTEGKNFTQKIFSKNYISEKYFSEFFGKLFPLVLWPDRGIQGSLGAPGGRQGVLRGKNFTRKIFSKNYISENYFSEFFGKLFPLVLWPDRGIQGSLGALGGRQGVLRGKIFTRKIFSKNYISENYFSGIFLKTFSSARVVARQGYLGIFGGPWGTLGGTEGEKFLREKFSPKIIYPKKYFSGIFRKTFSARVVARQGYLGIFGGPWGTLGGTEGNNFTRKIVSKNYISEKYFSGIFGETCFRSCCGPIGVFRDLWGLLGDAWGY